jgi:hypothetical protein
MLVMLKQTVVLEERWALGVGSVACRSCKAQARLPRKIKMLASTQAK